MKSQADGGAKAPQAPKSFSYKPQYGVIVLCASEEEHRRVFEELKAQGRRCRVVCT